MSRDERAPKWLVDVAMASSGAKGVLWQLGKAAGDGYAHESDLRTDLSAVIGDVLDAIGEVRALSDSAHHCVCSQIRPVSTVTA